MADSDKEILITPNISQTSQPEIKFVGKDNSPMYLKVLDDNTLSFEGTEGQVFSIGPTLSSGDIFSVSDISGVQSMSINANGSVEIDAQTQSTTIKNSASNTATLVLSNSNADAVDGPILEFFRDTASPADNDHMGSLVFTGRDDAGNKQEYGRITMHNDDATAASNGGELVFKLTEANADEQEYMRLRASSRQIEFNTQSDDIDFCYNTDATNDFFYMNAGTQRIGVGDAGTAPDYLLHLEGVDGGNGELFVERTSGAGLHFQAQSAAGIIGTTTNHNFQMKTNGSVRATITTAGRLGIGDTTPDAMLDVESNDGSIPTAYFYRNDSTTSDSLVKIVEDSVYADNPTLEVITDRTDGAIPSISVVGGAVTVSGNNGWNTWEKETLYRKAYGTASHDGSGLVNLSYDGQGTVNNFTLPYDAKLRAVVITYNFSSSSSSTTDQTWRLFHSGDPANVVTNFTFDVANDMTNMHGNIYVYTATGLDIQMNKNRTYAMRRESGTLDIQNLVRADVYFTRHTTNY